MSRQARLLLTVEGRDKKEVDMSVDELIVDSKSFRYTSMTALFILLPVDPRSNIIMNLHAISRDVHPLAIALYSKANELEFPRWVMIYDSTHLAVLAI